MGFFNIMARKAKSSTKSTQRFLEISEVKEDVVVLKDGTRYVFPSESVYFSYYDSFDDVVLVNDDQLRKLALGERIIMASGRMIKIQSDNRVFQTQNNRVIRHIPDEISLLGLYHLLTPSFLDS